MTINQKYKNIGKNYLIFTSFILLFVFKTYNCIAIEPNIKKEDSFYFDAIVFNSNKTGLGKVDIFTIVPYKSLKFLNKNNKYISKYELELNIFNSNSEVVINKVLPKNIIENEYFNTQGGKGNFDFNQISVDIPSGEYKISIKINDEFSNIIEEKTKNIIVIEFNNYSFSISGLMFLSDIEEQNGKFKITPFVSDNVAKVNNNLFVFFEVYIKNEALYNNIESNNKKVDFFIRVYDEKEKLIKSYPKFTKDIFLDSTQSLIKKQLFYRLDDLKGITGNNLTLKLFAVNSTISEDFEEINLLAISQRSIKSEVEKTLNIFNNLDLAIRQLRYVATQIEIDKIQNSKNETEKYELFNSFWTNLDPTKNTERNEAFEEYYERINYANQNFKSYLDGWLSDKGQVYIVLGKPNNIEINQDASRRVVYERWIYGSREFIFADNNGFGDFRLVRPYSFNEKYIYFER